MFVAFILMLVAIGSVLFHIFSPWWWTEIASNWGYIDTTVTLTFWITGTVFVAIVSFMAYCVMKFKHSDDRRADYQPENRKLEIWLTVLTAIGVFGMLAPGLFVWHQYVTVPDNAHQVEVLGQQWHWSFRYAGVDGKLGTTDPAYVNDDNLFGINPNDPDGQDDVLIDADDLHLLKGQPVEFLLRSQDVLHNFFIPQFRAKMDLVPGMITYFWVEPIRTGEFEILCAELCGTGHHEMRGGVIVENEPAFSEWMAEQSTFKQTIEEARLRRENKMMIAREGDPSSIKE